MTGPPTITALPLQLQPLAEHAEGQTKAITITTVEGVIVFVNRAFVSAYGGTPAACMGRSLSQLLSVEQRQRLVTAPVRDVDGVVRWMRVSRLERPGLRVLIVDDNPRVARALGRALRRHAVVLSDSGADALGRLTAQPFDVVLCDLRMPQMSGIELFERLQDRQPDLASRFLFTTGGPWSERSRRFIRVHADRVLSKPFRTEQVHQAIQRVTGRGTLAGRQGRD